MIIGDYVDVYKPTYNDSHFAVIDKNQSVIVLKIATGPAGWIIGLWSFLPRSGEYQLDISVCTSGLTSIGRTVLKVDFQISTYFDQLCYNLERNCVWHPSGQNIAIVEHGILIIASLRWIDKKKNIKVSMITANEIYSNTDEDMVIKECISVDVKILRQLNIGASSLSANHAENNLIIGTKNGLIEIVNWEGEVIFSNSTIVSENSSEERELFRLWKQSIYPLRVKNKNNQQLTMKGSNHRSDIMVDINDDEFPKALSYIKSFHFDEKSQTLVSLFADGSFNVAIFPYTGATSFPPPAPCSSSSKNNSDSSNYHELKNYHHYLLSTTKIHPILLVGYPLSSIVQSSDATKQQQLLPSIYELSGGTNPDGSIVNPALPHNNNNNMIHRSKDYITSYDVDNILDLSATLLAKVCRIKSLVNGSCLEEMGSVLEFRLLDDDDSESLHTTPTIIPLVSAEVALMTILRKIKLLMLIGTKHVPDNNNFISDQRLYSLSLVLLDINISSVPNINTKYSDRDVKSFECNNQEVSVINGTVECRCTQSVCINKNEKFSTGSWNEVSPHLELLRSSRSCISGLYVLALISGLITCRSIHALHSVVFTINTRIHYSSLSVEYINVVDMSVSLGKLIISVWSHNKTEAIEICDSSKVFMVSMLTSASFARAGSNQNQGYFIDYSDGSLFSHLTNHSKDLNPNRKRFMKSLKIPRSLITNIMFYQQLCAVSNPLIHMIGTRKSTYNFVQDGLLIASSKQSKYTVIEKENIEESKYSPFIKCKSFAAGNHYLALVAGGVTVPHNTAIRKIQNKRNVPYLLWIYNSVTRRWRSTHLNIGNELSNAMLLQDLTILYHHQSSSSNNVTPLDTSIVSHLSESSFDEPSNRIVENDFDPLLGDFKSNLPRTPKAIMPPSAISYNDLFYKTHSKSNKVDHIKNINIPITPKLHISGEVSAVIALAWFGDHTILLLTLRKSNYCLEILSREVTRPSLSIGKPYPLIHKIIEMPPGYSPNTLETRVVSIKENSSGSEPTMKTSSESLKPNLLFHSIDSNMSDFSTHNLTDTESKQQIQSLESKRPTSESTSLNSLSENCLAISSDGHHFICYQISKQYKINEKAKDNYDTSSYTPMSPSLTCSISDYLVFQLWDVHISELIYQPTINNTTNGEALSDNLDIMLPIQETHMFIQNAPILVQEFQKSDRRHREINISMLLLDVHRKVIFVDPLKKSYCIINKGPVYRILQFNQEDVLESMNKNELLAVHEHYKSCREDLNSNINSNNNNNTITTNSSTAMQINKINNCFLFYKLENKLYELHTNLINIFRNATLLKRFGRISENSKLETSKLWFSLETIESSDGNKQHIETQPNIRTLSIDFHNLQGIKNIETIDDEIYHHSYSSKCLNLININNNNNNNTHEHSQSQYDVYKISLKCYLFKVIFSNLVERATTSSDVNCVNFAMKNVSNNLVTDEIIVGTIISLEQSLSIKIDKVKLDHRLETILLENILSHILNSLHSKCRTTTNFLSQLELDTKYMIESIAHKNELHSHFSMLTSYLSSNSSLLLCELISRLGRKLEPSISKHLYPFCIGNMSDNESTSSSSVGVITMFEACLSANPPQLHHAVRTVSLACESMGGTEKHVTTTASLVLALELLYQSAHRFSLNYTLECFEFCLRLESMLDHLVDISYISTIKTQALALIRKERIRSNQCGTNVNTSHHYSDKRLDSSSSLLPYFIEIGINWLFYGGQFHNNNNNNNNNNDNIHNNELNKEDSQNQSTKSDLNNNNSESHNYANFVSCSKVNAIKRMKEMLLSSTEDVTINEFHYNAINALDKEYNDVLKLSNGFNQTLNKHTNNSDHLHSYNSPTLLLVILILKEFMHNETHYLNVAVFMSALLCGSSTFTDLIISHFSLFLLNKNINSTTSDYSSDENEKLRRLLYTFGLNKAIFSNNNILAQKLLQQRLSPQYIRRIIEANGTRNGSSSGYFELIDDMLNTFIVTNTISPSLNKIDNSEQIKFMNQDCLTLLTLLKSLLIGLLLVEDYTMVMLLLTKVMHKCVNPELHTMLYVGINNAITEGMSSKSLIRLIKVIVQNIV